MSPSSRAAGARVAPRRGKGERRVPVGADPLWYKHAVVYQLHIRSFCDSTGDGIGDFNGLISKLDYLADLGVTALWLQPFYPSPLRDDGYDIADYGDVNPSYGRVEEFRRFVEEAHRRGLRVITELVINHTSDRHPWFERARRAPKGSKARDFYVWSDTPAVYKDARIIFKDFERSNWTFDPVADQYFWHRFYSHQPDLNFDNPAVRSAVLEVCDFWMRMGVDGVRLDAIPYLYEREGTSCENLPETHEFLRTLRAHVERKWPGRMLLAEANQWPEDAVAYFGRGDECHMAFHFPLMPRLFMALRMEDRFPIIDILDQTPAIPASCQWAMFLRNHDELTLEMVTDEERDYMYRVYASDPQARINLGIRRRLAPLLSNNRRKIELLNALLFSMPGTPIIYYGDEIGMGDNVHLGDRNGVRTPMQWSADRNAGFSRANPQSLFLPAIIDPEYHYESINVESQLGNPSSLLWWMRRMIALRNRYPVFGVGEIRFLHPSNPRALAFLRSDSKHTILVVANLSRFVQPVELPMAELAGRRPVELFGKVAFPPITEAPYFITLGPHAFLWFLLEAGAEGSPTAPAVDSVIEVKVDQPWEKVLEGEAVRRSLERHMPAIVLSRRWFVSKARSPRAAVIQERIRLPAPSGVDATTLFIGRFEFTIGEPETYALPLAVQREAETVPQPLQPDPALFMRLVNGRGEPRRLVDALSIPDVARSMLRYALTGEEVDAGSARIVGLPMAKRIRKVDLEALPAKMPKVEQSNSTVFFGDKYVLKLFRRLDEGESPESEIGRHLTQRVGFPHIAPLLGSVELRTGSARAQTLAVVLAFVQSQGDAWSWMLEQSVKYFETAATMPEFDEDRGPAGGVENWLTGPTPPAALSGLHAQAIEGARLLGERTAALHAALGAYAGDPAFAPEPFTPMYQRAVYQSIRNGVRTAVAALSRSMSTLSPEARALAEPVVAGESALSRTIAGLREGTLRGQRIRIHGDYHLGQVLYTGKDFIIIDFEGEPLKSIGERKIKRSPLRDVAGMIRSFDYSAWAGLDRHLELFPGSSAGSRAALARAAKMWSGWTSRAFVSAYLATLRASSPSLLGPESAEHDLLMRAWLLEKTCYEIVYELNSRPTWVHIPLRAATELLRQSPHAT